MYSGFVYGQRCGQIQVPNDCHVVLFSGGRSAHNSLRQQRRKQRRAEKIHKSRNMWSTPYKEKTLKAGVETLAFSFCKKVVESEMLGAKFAICRTRYIVEFGKI